MTEHPVRLLKRFTGSLSFKLSFYAGLIMFLAIVAFAYFSIRSQERNLITKMIQVALKDSEVVKAAIWNGMMTNDREVIRGIVRAIGASGGFTEINVFDRSGVLRYSSQTDLTQRLQPEPNPLLGDIVTDESTRHQISDDGKWLYVVNPIRNTQRCFTAACHVHPENVKVLGSLAIKLPWEGVRAELYENVRRTVVLAFLLFLMISTIIGLAVIFLVNPNLRKLQDRAMKIARGEYEPLPPPTSSDEIAELSRTFDEMGRQVSERAVFLDSRRRFWKSLFDDVPCYLTVVSPDYRIVNANRTFREQFGDVVGKHCFVGYKRFEEKCAECPVEKTFADGQSHQSEEIWRRDGEEVYSIVKTAPMHDEQGNIVAVLEMSLDVTQLKRLQLELERKQEQYRNLFDKAPCYLTVVDRDFNLLQGNRLFEQDFGQRVGEKCYWAYKGRSQKCDNCPVVKTIADGESHTSEEIWRRDGEETNILIYTAPLRDPGGEITAVLEMATNITEVTRLQSKLALLGETIAGMSHTIKNILGGLQGGVYVVDSGLERQKTDRIATGWKMVKKNVGKLSELVQGILYASKEREPEYKECDPGKILTEVCDLYQAKAEGQNIDLVREFKPRLGTGLLDPAGIHSVLSNLISNSIDACRGYGDRRHRITVFGLVEEDRLLLEVADDGVGMPAEVKEKLFDKFYSTKGSKGTGLGLVITRKVIQEHGGIVRVESEHGKGTVFSMEIPFRTESKDKALRKAV